MRDRDLPRGADWLVGGGEMGRLIREKDWSRTPLGPLEDWPQSLRTAVSICLASNFPINIIWGPGRVQIYNDGYWPICGAKHPHSMGQDYKECWASAWNAVGGPFDNASAGRPDFLVNERMFLDRYGYLEETFFTFSLSPIHDETGRVGGLFHPVTEMTQQTLGERRLEVLRDVADRTTDVKTVEDACVSITETLTDHALDVPFALLYLLDPDARRATLAASCGLEPGGTASPVAVDLTVVTDEGWPLTRAVRDRTIVDVDRVDRRFGGFACGPYPEAPHTALVLPVSVSGLAHPFAVLVAGASARRALDEPYRTFFLMLRDGVTNALTNARAYAEERRRVEALAELDRAKTMFFSNVSHEFRTPITLMLGPLEELLRDGSPLDEPARSELAVVHRNGLRLLKLVNSMLDFSRIEAGRIRASYEPTDLGAYTAELASAFRSAIEAAGMRLVVECPAGGEPVFVDRDMWEKIVLNLVSNAFKYTLEGEICVSLAVGGEAARLTVADTGVGIAADELPRVFERFHRVTESRGRTYEGTGIGLALVQELVRRHGGSIEATSVPGRGSEFVVTVPTGTAHLDPNRVRTEATPISAPTGAGAFVQEALRWLPEHDAVADVGEPSPAPASDAPALGALTQSRSTVVLADDNADMRDYVTRLLRPGFDVVAVADGEQALAAVRAHAADLLLADVMMPGLDGLELVQRVRADPALATLPVVLLSARAGEEARIEGRVAGADDYLVKPFSARELVARVEAQIAMRRLRREATHLLRESEARTAFLLDLGDRLRSTTAVDDIVATASALLGEHLGVDSVTHADLDTDADRWVGRAGWSRVPDGRITGTHALSDFRSTRAGERAEGVPLVVDDVASDTRLAGVAHNFAALGIRAFVSVPLVKRSGPVHSLSVQTRTPRHWTDAEVSLVREVGERTWDAVERARAEAALRDRAMEQRRGRIRAELVSETVAALEGARGYEAGLQVLVDRLVPRVADLAVLQTSGGRAALTVVAHRDPALASEMRSEGERLLPELLGLDPTGSAGPALPGLVDLAGPEHAAAVHASAPRSAAVMELNLGGDTRGTLVVGLSDPTRRAYSADDLGLLGDVCDRAALVLAGARLREHEHQIARALQEALLPSQVLRHPDVTIGARYEAAGEAMQVGGDWYDSFALPDGRIGVTVGDVVGHDLHAAAMMGRLRVALAALAPQTEGPGELLTRLDEFARGPDGADLTTACCAFLDPATGAVRHARAGHPPMLLVPPTGEPAWLDGGHSAPLSALDVERRPEGSARLRPGGLLVLYSDGLVERRHESIDVGLDRLARTAAALRHLDVDAFCDRLLAEMSQGRHHDDDTVVLCLRLDPGR